MTTGFKESLSQINKITWIVLALSVSILVFNPAAESVSVLGITVDGGRSLFIIPTAVAGLMLMKQIMIRNVVEIINHSKDTAELKNIVMSYPLIEFMRWKFDITIESVFLTVVQVAINGFPGASLLLYQSILEDYEFIVPRMFTITGFVVLFLGLWSYRTLRIGVFEKLVGKIKTPD
ncbi:MAG: hypothetical protein GY755_00325 [Chloroflexi bacterium]|nr:hypothetical protein [Chloroflexota bacterium]